MSNGEACFRGGSVGHASARWRSARRDSDADARNQRLSSERAEAVKRIIVDRSPTRCSRSRSRSMSPGLATNVRPSRSEARRRASQGRRASRRQARQRRRVRPAGRHRDGAHHHRRAARAVQPAPGPPLGHHEGLELTVAGFREIVAGVANVDIDVELRNPLSGRVARGSAELLGRRDQRRRAEEEEEEEAQAQAGDLRDRPSTGLESRVEALRRSWPVGARQRAVGPLGDPRWDGHVALQARGDAGRWGDRGLPDRFGAALRQRRERIKQLVATWARRFGS